MQALRMCRQRRTAGRLPHSRLQRVHKVYDHRSHGASAQPRGSNSSEGVSTIARHSTAELLKRELYVRDRRTYARRLAGGASQKAASLGSARDDVAGTTAAAVGAARPGAGPHAVFAAGAGAAAE